MRGIPPEIVGGEVEEGHGGSEAAFLEMHEGTGPLDQPLVEGVVGPGFPFGKPEILENFMGLEVETLIEAVEKTGVVARQSIGIQTGQERGDSGAFVAHGAGAGDTVSGPLNRVSERTSVRA